MGMSNCRKTSSGLPLILCYDELYTYFILSHNVIIIEIKYTINVLCLNHLETIHPPSLVHGKILPWNQSLMPKRLGMAGICDPCVDSSFSSWIGHSVVTGTQRFLSPSTFITWVENYTAEVHTETVIDSIIHFAHPHCFLIFTAHMLYPDWERWPS